MKAIFLSHIFLIIIIFLFSCNKSDNNLSPEFSDDSNSNNFGQEFQVVELPNNFIDPIHEDNFNLLQSKLTGTWFGTMKTPWVDPYHIVFKVDESGVYSCYNITNNGYTAFYYGTDQDSTIKTFILKDLLSDGSAEGEMIQLFTSHTTNVDIIKDLRFYNDYQNLSFSIWHGDIRNPMKVFLYRLSLEK